MLLPVAQPQLALLPVPQSQPLLLPQPQPLLLPQPQPLLLPQPQPLLLLQPQLLLHRNYLVLLFSITRAYGHYAFSCCSSWVSRVLVELLEIRLLVQGRRRPSSVDFACA